jgi:hypothetical protein
MIAVARPPDPAADALLELLRTQVDDDMLREISEADYGHAAELHLSALRAIHATGEIPAPLPWQPKEVLELIRWSEPEDPAWKPGATGERGHRMRAFACAALLRAAADPAEALYADGENQTLAQLVASVMTLGEAAQRAALRFMDWRVDTVAAGGELPFFRLAQLILAVQVAEPDARVGRLAAQLTEDVAAERAEVAPCLANDRWLLGLTFHQIRLGVWVRLTHQLLERSAGIADADARAAVEEVALRVLCE